MWLPLFIAAFAANVAATALTEEQQAAVEGLRQGRYFAWPTLDAAQWQAIHEKAGAYLDRYQAAHLPQGLNADMLWTDRTRTVPKKYDGIGDSVTWTGHYLAALALMHRVTDDPEVRQRMAAVLDKFDMLLEVSGRPGYLPRYAGDASDPAYREYYSVYGRGPSRRRPGLGTRAYPGVKPCAHYVWLGKSSRDIYDGAALGLASVIAFVEDAALQAQARDIATRLGERLIADQWFIRDGQGSLTHPSPRWQLAMMRLLISANPDRFGRLAPRYARYADQIPRRGPRLPGKTHRKYYPANLNFARLFVLNILETDPTRRDRFQEALRNAYLRQCDDHLNAYFAAVYMFATGDTEEPRARATFESMMLDFPPPPKWARIMDHRGKGLPMTGKHFTRDAQYVSERIPRDFIWQRPPCLAHGGQDIPREYPGIDFFLPYWLGRACGVVPGNTTSEDAAENAAPPSRDPVAPLPRILVRKDAEQRPIFVRQDTRERFIPRGFNHTVLDERAGGWHATFNVGIYDPDAMEATLAAMRRVGANVIRVWAWGFQNETGFTGALSARGLNAAYMENFVDFLRRAARHGIYVIPILDQTPRNAWYDAIAAEAEEKDDTEGHRASGCNRQYLMSGPLAAKCAGARDFIRYIRDADPGLLQGVFAWALANEVCVKVTEAPFRHTEGLARIGGKSYDMADPAQRQACYDDAVLRWANALADAVKEADPDALVTAGMWTADAHGRPACNGLPLDGRDPRIPPRPSVLGGPESRLDFLDIHIYPWDGSSAVRPDAHEHGHVLIPVIVGEYGVFKDKSIEETRIMLHEMLDQAWRLGYQGDIHWVWDLTDTPGQTWSAVEHNLAEHVMRWQAPRR